jgi:flagellar basal body-associated protein FliL
MSRVEPQLREYFDAGVERISVEDVIAQAEVQENRLEPLRSRRTFKPAWAAVGAFAVTILGIGGLAAALKLTERITGEFGADAAEIVATDGGTLGIWLIAAFVAAIAAAGATWLIRRPAQNDTQDQQDQGKVMVVETIEDTDSDVGTTKETTKPNRWPVIVMAVLAVAVVGLIAWMIFAMRPNSPNAAPPEIVQLMEDYNAAWNAYDADALEALVTDGYRLYGPANSAFDHDMESIRSYLMPQLEDWDWQVTAPEPTYAVNTSGYTWAVSGEGAMITRSGIDHEQNSLWTIVGPDGEFLVSEHYMIGG